MAVKTTLISSYPIKLGQFLKLINVVQDGIEAKNWVKEGSVRVNGEVETRRGRQLQRNDCIELFDGTKFLLQ